MTLTLSYEDKRDLLIGMVYKRSNMQVASRSYTYDTLGRPTSRGTMRDGQSVSDSFAYNNRSELTSATVSGESYAYDYDNIGNRETAQEAAETVTAYATNSLNQYTAIGDFVPTFDDAGNQTLVKTSTGIWAVTYDAENRPTLFSNADSSTTVECTYDYMGRRATKRVTVNGSVTLYQRYIYRGYLQIACCDLTRSAQPALWLLTWDPTQTTATRPLAIQINGTWFTYGWDLTKNICEVYGQHGYIRTAYTYTPYGAVTMSGDLTQSIQWSSEYHDTELALVYYNYRHYNPTDGRWLGRDRNHNMVRNLYKYSYNPVVFYDYLGNGIYAKGKPVEPPIAFREEYPYDPTAVPTFEDRISYINWVVMDLGANIFRINPLTGNILFHAAPLYDHYLSGSGRDFWIQYEAAYDEDAVIKKWVDIELLSAQIAAEDLWDKTNSLFEITGTAVNVSEDPETEDWQKTIGKHFIWGSGTVTPCFNGNYDTMKMNISIRSKDLYDFNKGAEDIETGIEDSINGRFSQLGWAKAFITHGRIDFEVIWSRGDVLNREIKILNNRR